MSKNEGMTLTEFLEARIAEDEAALNAVPQPAKQLEDFDFGGTDDYLRFTMGYGRAVAECAAKRAIMDECREDHEDAMSSRNDVTEVASEVLYALATVYADHPDYQQEWSA